MNNDDNFTRNSGDLSPELEARVVAWVLGDASAFEAAQLDVLCAQQPELAVFKRRLEAVHGLLGEAVKPLKTPLLLSPERRAKVLAVIGGDAPTIESVVAAPAKARKQARSWRSWALPMAACFTVMTLLAAVIIPTVGSVRKTAHKKNTVVESGPVSPSSWYELKQEQLMPSLAYRKSEQEGDFDLRPNPEIRPPQSYGEPLDDDKPAHPAASMAGSGLAATDVDAPTMPDLPSSPLAANKYSTVTTTAGTPIEFNGSIVAESERAEAFRYQGQMLGVDADMAGAKRGHFAFGDQSNVRLESVPAEVRRRREFRPNPAADPFAAPAVEAPSEYASTSSLSEKKQDVWSDDGYRQPYGGAISSVSADQPVQAQSGLEFSDKDANPFIAEREKFKSSSDAREQDKLVAKGRSQYLAGDLAGAQDTFRTLESVAPENPVVNSFLGRISKEQASLGELNRAKTRSQMLQEVSSSWQRPGVYKETAKSSEPWDSPTQPRRKRSSVTITAGTPQTFEGIVFTEADQAEIARRVASRKAERLKQETLTPGIESGQQPVGQISREGAAFLGYESPSDYHDVAAVIAEFTKEIKALEAKADQKAKTVVDESLRAEIPTAAESVSTFSLHVSDASFRLAKAALERGQAPDPATIRPEEFYNAFDYGDPSPAAGEAVSCRVEQAAHPFLQQRNLVRIAMKVPAAGRGAGQPLRLTVMLDTSGSMERDDRAATVRAALTALTSLLGPDDRVTLVGFARTPTLLAEGVPGDQAAKIIELAARTPAEGGTNLEEALALAGKLAMRQKLATAQNRIVLLTDGAANLGDADPQALAKRVEALRQNGIAFDACGVVADGLDDSVLEALTRKGDGRYAVINSPEEADANFARQLAGAFRPAAKDVKVQVHFNPARVAWYRLIGFEKHRLKTEDFRNDKIDAAELAAEEAAVALYQVEVLPEGEGELGEVAVRFLDTRSNERVERSWTLAYSAQPAAFARATPSLQLAGSAAFLAEKLRGGALAGQVRLDEFAPVVEGLGAAYPQAGRVREFIEMFRQARRVAGE